jgi:hypothetical protein
MKFVCATAGFSVSLWACLPVPSDWAGTPPETNGYGSPPAQSVPGSVAPPWSAGCLIAHYSFDGNGQDDGPNHLDGALYGSVAFGPDECGRPGSAYVLDGHSSYANLGASPLLKPPRVVSVAAWIEFDDLGATYQNILSDHAPDEVRAGYAYTFRFAKDDLQFLAGGVYGLGRATYANFVMPPSYLRTWQHVAGVYDGASVLLYVDGVLVNWVPFREPMKQNGNVMLVGRSGYGEFFAGSIADLRIYGCPLDDRAIASLYRSACR